MITELQLFTLNKQIFDNIILYIFRLLCVFLTKVS